MDIQDGKESLNTDNETNSSDVSAEVKDNLGAETEKVLKKRTFKFPLKIVEKPICPGALWKEMLFDVKTRLEELIKRIWKDEEQHSSKIVWRNIFILHERLLITSAGPYGHDFLFRYLFRLRAGFPLR